MLGGDGDSRAWKIDLFLTKTIYQIQILNENFLKWKINCFGDADFCPKNKNCLFLRFLFPVWSQYVHSMCTAYA